MPGGSAAGVTPSASDWRDSRAGDRISRVGRKAISPVAVAWLGWLFGYWATACWLLLFQRPWHRAWRVAGVTIWPARREGKRSGAAARWPVRQAGFVRAQREGIKACDPRS